MNSHDAYTSEQNPDYQKWSKRWKIYFLSLEHHISNRKITILYQNEHKQIEEANFTLMWQELGLLFISGREEEKILFWGSKVIDPALKHYKWYFSNSMFYKGLDDLGVKMDRIILGEKQNANWIRHHQNTRLKVKMSGEEGGGSLVSISLCM